MFDSYPTRQKFGTAPAIDLFRQKGRAAVALARNWYDKPVPVLFIIFFCMLLWGGQYVRRQLWEPDEARFTYISWEMNQRGNWLVPYRDGQFYAHKPPLMFWLIKIGTVFTAGRFNQIAGRLPTLLGLILALWAIARIAAAWVDRQAAWRTIFVLCTSSLFWQKGGMGQIDMLLLGLQLTALHLLFTTDESPAAWRSAMAFGFMGLAVLAKGPIGLIIPAGIYVFANLAAGQGRLVLRRHWLWGLPIALAPPLLWLAAARWSGAPDAYFMELLFDQNVGRLAGKFGGHRQPFYYFLKYLPLDFLPWTVFMPIVLGSLWIDAGRRRLVYRLVAWMAFVVIFFSLSGSKRNLYILSVYPAAAMLVAAAMPLLSAHKMKWQAIMVYTVAGMLGIIGLASMIAPLSMTLPVEKWPLITAGCLLASGSALLLLLFRRLKLNMKWFAAFIGFLISVEIIAGSMILPAFNPIKTPVELSRVAPVLIPPDKPLLLFQMTEEILSLYAKRQGMRIDDSDEMINQIKEQGKGIVVFQQAKWAELQDRFIQFGGARPFRVGSQRFVWLAFN